MIEIRGANVFKTAYSETIPIKKKPRNRGKWCFEFTYISGNGCVCAGFESSDGFSIQFYGNLAEPSLFYQPKYNKDAIYSSMNMQIMKEMSTYAVLIDIDMHIFSIIHDDERYEYNFGNDVTDEYYYQAKIFGACNTMRTDYIWVNLGEKKFINKIPIGYKPWIEKHKLYSCNKIKRGASYLLSMIIIFLCSS